MAYVPVPKDLSKVKTKVAFNLTKRQIVCFAAALLFGLPLFFLLKDSTGTSLASMAMIAVMLPCFLFAMYEKHGQPLEVVVKNISLRRKPVYQSDLDDIEMYFMAAVKEIKKGIGSHYAEQEALSKKVAEKMFNELTKGQDVQRPNITAEQVVDVVLDSVSDMEGATPETLEQLRSGLLGVMQSQGNAHEADE